MPFLIAILAAISAIVTLTTSAEAAQLVRIGYFANITHAQALVGRANGLFEKSSGGKIEWKVFNAGPTAMEALLAGSLDMAYVGPNPAVNAYFRSKGKVLRVIAGAASGGASLVVLKDSGIRTAADLKGKKIASPEYGNTQDISLRYWLKSQGLKPGRDVQVMPIKNSEILDFFGQKRISAAWVPEPWVARLVDEAGGRVLLDERSLWPDGKFPTAVLVVRKDFLDKNRELVSRLVDAHIEATRIINKSPLAAEKIINSEIAKISKKLLPEPTFHDAMSRLTISYDPVRAALYTAAERARELGFLPSNSKVPLAEVIDLSLLNENLARRGLAVIK